jgi:hypothetical protein
LHRVLPGTVSEEGREVNQEDENRVGLGAKEKHPPRRVFFVESM